MYVNDITFAGNVGTAPEDRNTAGGTRVVSFSLAHNDRRKEGGNQKEVVTWVRVVVFGNWCDYAMSIRKGDNVLVKGKLNVRTWEKQDGSQGVSVEIIPFAIAKIARDESRGSGDHRGDPGRSRQSSEPTDPDEIPF